MKLFDWLDNRENLENLFAGLLFSSLIGVASLFIFGHYIDAQKHRFVCVEEDTSLVVKYVEDENGTIKRTIVSEKTCLKERKLNTPYQLGD